MLVYPRILIIDLEEVFWLFVEKIELPTCHRSCWAVGTFCAFIFKEVSLRFDV